MDQKEQVDNYVCLAANYHREGENLLFNIHFISNIHNF